MPLLPITIFSLIFWKSEKLLRKNTVQQMLSPFTQYLYQFMFTRGNLISDFILTIEFILYQRNLRERKEFIQQLLTVREFKIIVIHPTIIGPPLWIYLKSEISEKHSSNAPKLFGVLRPWKSRLLSKPSKTKTLRKET